jgi:hypothetical protein
LERLQRGEPEDRKRVEKETRTYLPLTNQAIHEHLAGKQTIGAYPLLLDGTCWFLAADFDKNTWQEDATAFLESCGSLGIPLPSKGRDQAKAAMSALIR